MGEIIPEGPNHTKSASYQQSDKYRAQILPLSFGAMKLSWYKALVNSVLFRFISF